MSFTACTGRAATYHPAHGKKTATYNAGLDYGFLNNRISGSVDVYYKKTTDLLNQIDQPAGTNFSNKIVANIGSMENRGVEFNINAGLIRKADINWNVNFNLTYNKNKVTQLTAIPDPSSPGNKFGGVNGGTGNTIQINAVDYNRASFFVYQQVYDENDKPIEGLFEDRNRDGVINENDLYEFKNPDPKFFYGLSSDFTWKKWTAGFTARASYGNYLYNNVYSNLGRFNTIANLPTIVNNASVNYLSTGFIGSDVRELLSDYYIQNASFIRMDNIYIGFNAGNLFGGKTGLRINAGVQNAFVITNYDGG